MNDVLITVRVPEEYRSRLKKAAASVNRSITEIVLDTVNKSMTDLYLHTAKEVDKVIDAMKPGPEREKAREYLRETLEEAKYWQNQKAVMNEKRKVYQEIESLEIYRDLVAADIARGKDTK